MSPQEQYAYQFTSFAWECAQEYGARSYQKNEAIKQKCDFCEKTRGLGYIILTEHGASECIFCRERKINS